MRRWIAIDWAYGDDESVVLVLYEGKDGRPVMYRADDDEWRPDAPMMGAASVQTTDAPDEPAHFLIPDRDAPGGWRKHYPEPARRPIGFRS